MKPNWHHCDCIRAESAKHRGCIQCQRAALIIIIMVSGSVWKTFVGRLMNFQLIEWWFQGQKFSFALSLQSVHQIYCITTLIDFPKQLAPQIFISSSLLLLRHTKSRSQATDDKTLIISHSSPLQHKLLLVQLRNNVFGNAINWAVSSWTYSSSILSSLCLLSFWSIVLNFVLSYAR